MAHHGGSESRKGAQRRKNGERKQHLSKLTVWLEEKGREPRRDAEGRKRALKKTQRRKRRTREREKKERKQERKRVLRCVRRSTARGENAARRVLTSGGASSNDNVPHQSQWKQCSGGRGRRGGWERGEDAREERIEEKEREDVGERENGEKRQCDLWSAKKQA